MALQEGPEATESLSRHTFRLETSLPVNPTIEARIDAVVAEVERRREQSMSFQQPIAE
jgi:hypothetical protein